MFELRIKPASRSFKISFAPLSFDTMSDEETPLLRSAEGPVAKEPDEAITPLPRLRIGILLFILLPEPICSQCIYPFINQVTRRPESTPKSANAFAVHQRAGYHGRRRK